MGRQVYSIKTDSWDNWVYVFVHSAPGGGRTVAIVNLRRESRSFLLKGSSVAASLMREEYWLNAPGGVLTRQVHLNGKPLQLTDDDTVPPLVPLVKRGVSEGAPESVRPEEGHWVTIPAQSILFVRFLDDKSVPFRPSIRAPLLEEEGMKEETGNPHHQHQHPEEKEEDRDGGIIRQRERHTHPEGKEHDPKYLPTYGQGLLWLVGLVAFVWCFLKWAQHREQENATENDKRV